MRDICFLLFLLLPAVAFSQDRSAYNRDQIRQWIQEGSWDELLAAAEKAEITDTFLLQSAGYAAYQSGDKSAAAAYFDRLLALDSNNRQALYYNGVMLKSDERFAEAIPLLRRLVRIVPDASQYHVLLADCYSAEEERSAAARHLQTARNLSPGSAVIANKLAAAWMRLKAWDSASRLLSTAMSEHPRNPALISTAISLAYSKKQYAQASALTDSLIATGKLRYESLITGLYADIALPDYGHAVRIGEVLMALGSETEEVLYYTAQAHQRLGNWKAADTLLRKCVARVLKPNLEAYYISMAEGAAQLKDWKRAAALYDTAYYLFKNPQTLYRKGLALQDAGRKGEAEQAYRKYLSLPAGKQDTSIANYLKKVVR